MALPEDFNKIYGSIATGGLTPISDVNYAKGWEFVGANPPTKNDFSYLQNLSDRKSQWLYSNKLQRTNPFGDIKSDGAAAVSTALSNLGLGDSSFGFKNMVVFSTAGVTAWTVPDVLKNGRLCEVEVIGAGGSGGRTGGGAAGGGGGGGGGISKSILDLTGVSTVSVTVGLGGAGVTSGSGDATGATGGASSFGAYLSATGGSGGGFPSGGAGGVGSGGQFNSSYGPGTPGGSIPALNAVVSGTGGGPGAQGQTSTVSYNGNPGRAAGGGGSGAAVPTAGGLGFSGAGRDGIVIVRW